MFKYIIKERDAISAAGEIKEYCNSIENPILANDLETYSKFGFQPRPILRPDGSYEGNISLFQIGLDPRKVDIQYLFDVRYLGENLITELFKGWIEDVLILGQNYKYDWGFLYKQLNIYIKKIRDTMLISQVVNAGDDFVSHSLPGLFDFFFGNTLYNWFIDETGMDYKEYFKHKQRLQTSDWSKELTEEQLKYAADDVRLIFYLYEQMKKYLAEFSQKYNLTNINEVIKLECNLIPVFAMKELRGVEFDIEHHKTFVIPYLEKLLKQYEGEVARHFSRQVRKKITTPYVQSNGRIINKTIGYEDVVECINLNSWQQIKEALRPYCGENWYRDKGGTDVNTLIHYVNAHESIPYIMKYKKIAKNLNTYGYNLVEPLVKDGKPQVSITNGRMKDKYLLHEDGRFHPQTYQIGQEDGSIVSGRSSYSDPNLLAQPAKGEIGEYKAADLMRTSYIAGKKKKWISLDLSNIEGRKMADRTGDLVLTEILNDERRDLYQETAREVLELDHLPGMDSEERKVGKQTFLSLQYLMGINKYKNDILKNTGIIWDFETSRMRRDLFLTTYSGIREAQDRQVIKLERIFAAHDSLADFAMDKNGRKRIYLEKTDMHFPRSWFLTEKQEELARNKPEVLHRDYEVLQSDGRYSTWGNEYNSYCHQIARESFNLPVQGAVANIVKLAQLEIHNELIRLNFPDDEGLVIVPHDEVNLIVSEERAELALKIAQEAMIKAARRFIKRVPVLSKGGIGDNWAEAH